MGKTFNVYSEHYIQTAAGKRFRETRGLKDEKVLSREQQFHDGSKCARVAFNRDDPEVQDSVVIKRQFGMEDQSDRRDLPQPLLQFYVGREPLYQALTKGRPLGQAKVMGRGCDVFLLERVRWSMTQDQVFYLDQQNLDPAEGRELPR